MSGRHQGERTAHAISTLTPLGGITQPSDNRSKPQSQNFAEDFNKTDRLESTTNHSESCFAKCDRSLAETRQNLLDMATISSSVAESDRFHCARAPAPRTRVTSLAAVSLLPLDLTPRSPRVRPFTDTGLTTVRPPSHHALAKRTAGRPAPDHLLLPTWSRGRRRPMGAPDGGPPPAPLAWREGTPTGRPDRRAEFQPRPGGILAEPSSHTVGR